MSEMFSCFLPSINSLKLVLFGWDVLVQEMGITVFRMLSDADWKLVLD